MPIITRPDSARVESPTERAALLAALGLGLRRLDPPAAPALNALRVDRHLTPERSAEILAAAAPLLARDDPGRDVVAFFPDTPGLAELEAKFRQPHRHADAEVRFILWGQGVFGFVLPDGDQVEITVSAGDLIDVPAGAEHWFRLTPTKELIALRLFGAAPRWTAELTGTAVRFSG